jgi:hypothetical protein
MLFGMHVPGPSGVVLRENPPVAQLPELHTGANRQTAMVFFLVDKKLSSCRLHDMYPDGLSTIGKSQPSPIATEYGPVITHNPRLVIFYG